MKRKMKFEVRKYVVDHYNGARHFAGSFETWAVSASQAANQVRYRQGYPVKVTECDGYSVEFQAY